MKTRIFQSKIIAVTALVAAMAPWTGGAAQNTDQSTTVAAQVAVSGDATAAVKLPYGVPEIVKLTQANVSEDVIVAYIENSGTVYNLNPEQIVYLREHNCSDRVISVMISQRAKYVSASAQAATPQTQYSTPPAVVQSPATYAQPAPVYVQPASSVYVIPYPAVSAGYYSSYSSCYRPSYCAPYYYGSYNSSCYRPYYRSYYSAPAFSFNFGFGGGHGGHFGGGHFGSHGHRR